MLVFQGLMFCECFSHVNHRASLEGGYYGIPNFTSVGERVVAQRTPSGYGPKSYCKVELGIKLTALRR